MADESILKDINQFKDRWMYFPIAQTSRMLFELLNDVMSLKQIMDDFYFSKAEQFNFWRNIHFSIKKFLSDKDSEDEKKLWEHPLTNLIFDAWYENIEGAKRGLRVEAQEKIAFYKYLYERLDVMHNPQKSKIYENFQNLTFSLKMLRPNNQVHIYLAFSFMLRPLKNFIRQYLDMAIITGDYELLARRYPPYFNMLSLNVFPGQRTAFDSRGLDFPPIIYKYDMKFNVALSLNNIQTRNNNRFITCPIIEDPELERQRQGEIKAKEDELNSIFPPPAMVYIGNVDFGEDGKVYLKRYVLTEYSIDKLKEKLPHDIINKLRKLKEKVYFGEDRLTEELESTIGIDQTSQHKDIIIENSYKPKEIPMYGMRRGRYLHAQAELTLLKSIPRPGSKSGLIIRFNLLHPIATLLEGINRKRDLTIDEIKYVWKILDRQEKEVKKDKDVRKNLNAICDEVFANPNSMAGLKDETIVILNEVERLRAEDPSEEKAWRYLTARLLENKGRALLQAICLRLIGEGFELVFALWPLITGQDITIDTETGQVFQKDSRFKSAKKSLLPLLEVLKREMEDLLKNVFTKYLDISAATNRIRSEPALAGMIAAYCLNVKSDTHAFTEKLKNHLYAHYWIHYNFLDEYLKGKPPAVPQIPTGQLPAQEFQAPSVLQHIHRLEIKGEDVKDSLTPDQRGQIERDVNGIMELIQNTRNRLYSSGESSRLLCFIDPHSVDVHIGNFIYSGKELEAEEDFIARHQERVNKLAELQSEKRMEVDARNIQRMGNKQIKEMEKAVLRVMEEYETARAQSIRRIREIQLQTEFSEVKFQAIEKLKQGNFKEYAVLSLIKAHHEGGVEEVEKILSGSPNIVMAIDPHLHDHQEIHEMKEKIIEMFGTYPEKIDPISMAMLLSKDFKNIVAADIYKDFIDTLSKLFPKIGLMPMRGGATGYDAPNEKRIELMPGNSAEGVTGQEE